VVAALKQMAWSCVPASSSSFDTTWLLFMKCLHLSEHRVTWCCLPWEVELYSTSTHNHCEQEVNRTHWTACIETGLAPANTIICEYAV
jgi:hypothetical protein